MGLNYNPSIVSEGLVFYLDAANRRCYSGSGLTANGLVGSINGSLVNGVGFTSTNNGSFSFDGSNDYINLPTNNLPYGSVPRTICCWFLASSLAYEWAFSYGFPGNGQSNALGIILGVITYAGYGGNDVYGPAPSLNTWYYVCGVYNGSIASLYVNGSLYTSSAKSWNTGQSTAQIGRQTNGGEFWNGNIGQAKIYNRALTPQEIAQNFNATRYRYGI